MSHNGRRLPQNKSAWDQTALWDALAPDYLESARDGPGGILLFGDEEKRSFDAIGYADVEQSRLIDQFSKFHLASVSKQFTAFVAAQLIEEGRLDLACPITELLPDLPADLAACRVRHLLFHSSGLQDQWILSLLAGRRSGDAVSTEDILRYLSSPNALQFEPGTAFRYTNSGYTLLAKILEDVTRTSFGELVAELVFKPAGMSATWATAPDSLCQRRVRGYGYRGSDLVLNEPRFGVLGSTGLRASADDMEQWFNFLSSRDGRKAGVFDRFDSVGTLDDGTPIPYGYGQFVAGEGRDAVRRHGGWDHGLNSIFSRRLDGRSFAFGATNGSFPAIERIVKESLASPPTAATNHLVVHRAAPKLVAGAYADDLRKDVRTITVGENGEISLQWMQGFEIREACGRYRLAGTETWLEPVDEHKVRFGDANGVVELTRQAVAESIENFAGLYYCPSLGSTITIGARGSRLWIQLADQPARNVSAYCDGLLVWGDLWAVLGADHAGNAVLNVSHPRALQTEFFRARPTPVDGSAPS